MGCSATRSQYKVYLVIGGSSVIGHRFMLEKLNDNQFNRIINLDNRDITTQFSSDLENNPNYKQLKSDLQNRGILFALFIQHDFDGLIICHESGSIEQYEELFDVATIQWDDAIKSKQCLLLEPVNISATLIDVLLSNYRDFNFKREQF